MNLDESKARIQIDRAERAQRILDDPLMKEALEKIKAQIIEAWKNSAADDERVRERAYLALRLHSNFRDHFRQIVHTGEAAKHRLFQNDVVQATHR